MSHNTCLVLPNKMELDREEVAVLWGKVEGEVLQQADVGYEAARVLWNASIDKHPALIIRPKTAGMAEISFFFANMAQEMGLDGVVEAVKFARAHPSFPFSVRGGGHNAAGYAICDGIVLDLSLMRQVRVDPASKVVRVQGGCILRDIDQETAKHDLVVPMGVNSTTGIGGLCLGGGFGWLSRKYGLTIDHLIGAQVVLADGSLVTCSEDERPDLYWAVRGGGGNFGVITEFVFLASDMSPFITGGFIVQSMEHVQAVHRAFCTLMNADERELTAYLIHRLAPPLPFVPQNAVGKPVVMLAWVYAGVDIKHCNALLQPIRTAAPVLAEILQPHMKFVDWQCMLDEAEAFGARNYIRGQLYNTLAPEVADAIQASIGQIPSTKSEILIGQIGGAVSDLANEATAFPHRNAQLIGVVQARWTDAKDDENMAAWVRVATARLAPYTTGAAYSNFMGDVSQAKQTAATQAFGVNYQALRALKRKYDPENLFRHNLNITPAE